MTASLQASGESRFGKHVKHADLAFGPDEVVLNLR